MNFAPTTQQQRMLERARACANLHLRGRGAAREACQTIEPALISLLGEHGLLGVNVPEVLGGQAAGAVSYVLALREMAGADAAVAVTMAVTNMVAEALCQFGTLAQRERYVPMLVSGKLFGGAFALSEPEAGSDAAALTTRAARDGSGWRLHGQKMWITTGDQAGVMVVWARTGEPGARGISCFLVEAGTPGVSFGKPEEKMGLRASHTVSVSFDQVFVAAAACLGPLGDGFKIAMSALDGGRIGISAQATGLGYAALLAAIAHVEALPDPGECGLAALGEMAAQLEAGWLLCLRAATLKDAGRSFSQEAAMAKVYASEAANGVIRRAIAVVGAAGTLESSGLPRLFRDARVTQVYEGTSEIQRMVISRAVLKGSS